MLPPFRLAAVLLPRLTHAGTLGLDTVSTFLVIFNIAAIHFATAMFVPEVESSTEPFIFLSYPVPGRPGFYEKGYKVSTCLALSLVYVGRFGASSG